MLKLTKFIAISAMLAFTTPEVMAPGWSIDKNHSSITFEINHFFTPVVGTFKDFEGTLEFDPNDLATSKADFTVQIASVSTNNERRDKDLVSNSFFNAKKYPVMSFKSTGFSKDGDNYTVKGNLTIKDVTKEVSIPFKVLGYGDHPMKKGKKILAVRAEFTLDRTDYHVGEGNWAATAVVGDEVKVTVLLEAVGK